MKAIAVSLLLTLPFIANGATVFSLDISTMQTDTSDSTLPAYNGANGRLIPLNTEVPVLVADESYTGPDVYGGVARNIFKGGPGVSNQGGSGWRIRVNSTVPFDENTANSGQAIISGLHVFKVDVEGNPVQFTEGNDLIDASNIFTSDMARVENSTLSFVIRDGGSWYISEASANLQTGELEGNTVSLYSVNGLTTTWYDYDPLTDVSIADGRGAVAAPSLTGIDWVGFLLESTSIETQGGYNFGVRVFTVDGEAGTAVETWAGYPILDEAGNVDTGPFLGFVNVATGDWIYSYSLEKYIYLPEVFVSGSGAWSYVPNF